MTSRQPQFSALFTDLYQLTMGEAYYAEGFRERAAFELFFRKLPATRRYIVAAGLGDVLDVLGGFRFTADDLAALERQGTYSADFLDHLESLRFTGDVDAVPEGTPVFPNEPLIRVEAPIIEAQLVETVVLNQIHFQSVVASKAARVVCAADGRDVVDFGSRRAHGAEAAVKVARASYLAGAAGTSNVLAGACYDIPIFGTMAHSYIQAHDSEVAALDAFAKVHPGTTLLVDTYDTLDGVRKVIDLCRRNDDPRQVAGIRLDSGDLGGLAKRARGLLDGAGLSEVRIFASGGLDESSIRDLLAAGAPIDGFGVGTSLAVSDDAPALDMAYKLVAYGGTPRMKLSSDKATYPGSKQVYRVRDGDVPVRDTIGTASEELTGTPLLIPYMRDGRLLADHGVDLERARERARREIARLPKRLLEIDAAGEGEDGYPVEISRRLERERSRLAAAVERKGAPR